MKKALFFAAAVLLLALYSCAAIVNTEKWANSTEDLQSAPASFAVPEQSAARSEAEQSEILSSGRKEESGFPASADESSSKESSNADTPSAELPASSDGGAVPAYSYAIDIEPYLQYICVSDLLLVNKEVCLPADYVPDNLVDITYTRAGRAEKEKMVSYAEKALCALLEEAYSFGYTDVTVTSGYRSYAKQEWLFRYYVENEMKSGKNREQAEAAANTYSARPGTSEHQSGLCVDMHNLPGADQSFGKTEAGKWLAANAHRFGFILRFPKGKEEITGYSYEPWHFRFVGKEHAGRIYAEGLCLEEYLQKYFPEKASGQNK